MLRFFFGRVYIPHLHYYIIWDIEKTVCLLFIHLMSKGFTTFYCWCCMLVVYNDFASGSARRFLIFSLIKQVDCSRRIVVDVSIDCIQNLWCQFGLMPTAK